LREIGGGLGSVVWMIGECRKSYEPYGLRVPKVPGFLLDCILCDDPNYIYNDYFVLLVYRYLCTLDDEFTYNVSLISNTSFTN